MTSTISVTEMGKLNRSMTRHSHSRYWLSVLGLTMTDAFAFFGAYMLFRRHSSMPAFLLFTGRSASASASIELDVFGLLCVLFIVVRYLTGDYSRRQLFWDGAKVTTIALIIAAIPDVLMLLIGRGLYSSSHLMASWLFLIVAIPTFRQGARILMSRVGIWQIPTAIIGVGPRTSEICSALRESLSLGFDVRWLVVDRADVSVPASLSGLPTIHSSNAESIAEQIRSQGGKEAIVAGEDMQSAFFADVVQRLLEVNIRVAIIPSINRLPMAGVTTNYFFGRDILLLQVRGNGQRLPSRFIKRLFDIVFSAILLLVLAPLFLILAVIIKRGDSGNAIYTQTRIGRNGRPFQCLKFRTMVIDADAHLKAWQKENPDLHEEFLKAYKLKDDPRITPIGKWLRKTSLDELPQLFNVLRGEMSLVGPRPVVSRELEEYYGPAAQIYIRTRPGMTGLWQVSGRSDTSYERRVILDEWYILNWSFWYDIVILIQTAWIVVTSKGAI
jgi:undecaprenyl-phosphate galactose phosphotransferase